MQTPDTMAGELTERVMATLVKADVLKQIYPSADTMDAIKAAQEYKVRVYNRAYSAVLAAAEEILGAARDEQLKGVEEVTPMSREAWDRVSNEVEGRKHGTSRLVVPKGSSLRDVLARRPSKEKDELKQLRRLRDAALAVDWGLLNYDGPQPVRAFVDALSATVK